MEPEGSLPHSQLPATCPYPEPDQSCTCHTPSHFLKIHFNIVLPPTPGFSKWSLSLSYRHQNPVYLPASLSRSPQLITPALHIMKLLRLYTMRLNIKTVRKDCCVPPYSRVQNCVRKAVCCPSWYKQGCIWRFISANVCYVVRCLSGRLAGWLAGWLLPLETHCCVFGIRFEMLTVGCTSGPANCVVNQLQCFFDQHCS